MNDALIRRLAGEASYRRGLDYFSHGHVESLEDTNDGARALVRGHRNYTVTLTAEEGMLDYSCDCPTRGGAFCKHCVAAALAWLNRPDPAKRQPPRKAKEVTLADAAKLLREEGKEALVTMILEWAKDDPRLRERLILYAARRVGPDAGAAAVERAFEKAVRVRGFVHYREAPGWARGVNRAIDPIEQLLNEGRAAAVIELCESALQLLVNAIQAVDDSDGHFAVLRDRLQDIHYRACLEARPEPAGLANRLLRWELHGGFDVFYRAAERYAKILGSEGLEVYRELAETEWAKAPVRTDAHDRSGSGHFRIKRAMESLARASGDIEELVKVMSRDLGSAYNYWQIANVYREAGQHDNALLWAEKGLKAFPASIDGRLREFVADEYHRRGCHDEAMKLVWPQFSDQPCLGTYQALEKHAREARAWPEWRERALTEIRTRIAKEKARSQNRPSWLRGGCDHSLLVEIFLYEGKAEDAWREAGAGGCSGALWLRLAAIREEEHPEDAAPIYLKYAEAAVATITNGRYEDAVGLLAKAATVMKRLNQSAEFVRHLEILCAKFKNKRNFMKLVDRERQSLYLI